MWFCTPLVKPIRGVKAWLWLICYRFTSFPTLTIDVSSRCLVCIKRLTDKFRSFTALVLPMLSDWTTHDMVFGLNKRMLLLSPLFLLWIASIYLLQSSWNLIWKSNQTHWAILVRTRFQVIRTPELSSWALLLNCEICLILVPFKGWILHLAEIQIVNLGDVQWHDSFRLRLFVNLTWAFDLL